MEESKKTRDLRLKLIERLKRLDLLEEKLEIIASILRECKDNGQVFGTIDQLKQLMLFIGEKECEEK